ncbi:MAG: response regulator transcription factor [Anaerolineaceae bacterium]|nr:response regulator transcription factor [Anaerolineaceae bacterium]
MTAKILLADDHAIVRDGLKALLKSEEDFQVIGEAADGLEAVRLIERLRPDVAVLDLMMPGLNGLEVTRQVARITNVIILSMHANEAYVIEALRKGAMGYILKDSTSADLVKAIRDVIAGKRYLSQPLSESMVDALLKRSRTGELDPYETLTTREREVFQLVAQGKSNVEISELLTLSPRTVEIHRANMMHKLNLESQADLIRLAIKRGVISLD